MAEVTEKRVLRYFYRGKGYGSRLAAYQAKAKDVLMDLALGVPVVHSIEQEDLFTGRCYEDTWTERPKLVWMGDQSKQPENWRKEQFAKAMREFGFDCENAEHPWVYHTGEPEQCPETYGFCGRAYKAWIRAKALELMKADATAAGSE